MVVVSHDSESVTLPVQLLYKYCKDNAPLPVTSIVGPLVSPIWLLQA